jgi:hypothetical protein
MATETKAKTKKAKPAKTLDTKKSTAVKHADHVIKTKRSGRYLVLTKDGKTVNGAEKTKILLEAKLISAGTPKAKEEASAPTT